MTKKTLILSVLILGLFASYGLYRSQSQTSIPTSQKKAVGTFRAPQARAQSQPSPSTTTTPAVDRGQVQRETEELQTQLSNQEQQLEVQKQQLEGLRRQQAEQELVQRQASLSYPAHINSNQEQIQNLNDLLEDHRLAEQDLNQRADAELRNQNSAAQLARTQIDDSIRALQENIQQTQAQINFWSTNFYDMTERDNRLTDLRTQLANQTQQLETLRNQRLNLSANLLSQTQGTTASTQQQKANLVENENAIQTEIQSLRDQVRRLEYDQNRTRLSSATLNSQISQAQRNLENQSDQIQATEEALRARQQQLGTVR